METTSTTEGLARAKSKLMKLVVDPGLCVGCGACVTGVDAAAAAMRRTAAGIVPSFAAETELSELYWEACPGKGVDYPRLYQTHYGRLPDDWRLGIVRKLWVGHAADPEIRKAGASGGVITAVLIHLLETRRIDGAILVRQGLPSVDEASYFMVRTRDEILACAQSVYIPVSVLDSLREFVPRERYAMTCLPEQSAALRVLQHSGHSPANQVRYVLGPYTGTALQYAAIRALLRINGVPETDAVVSLKWRAGEWPGYFEALTAGGRTVRSKKVYYNYLIPFYATQASLQSMDFANEFADLAVGDAWSPEFERIGGGFSVFAARNDEMADIIEEMVAAGKLSADPADALEASAMHGHMIDFKKRGGYLRNQLRRALGLRAADYGLTPAPIGPSRILVEMVVSMLFAACRSRPARWSIERVPESILGPLFNGLRLAWKSVSKPSKRKGLRTLTMRPRTPTWREECK